MDVLPGVPTPQGATVDDGGINFSIFSKVATRVEVCLFDPQRPENEIGRFDLPETTDYVWHGYARGLKPGALYGYRVHGPYAPEQGHRCNPAKLLVDPYAKALHGKPDWKQPLCGYVAGGEKEDLEMDTQDDSRGVPRSVAVKDAFDWGNDARPAVPWRKTVLYEAHVKGLTMLHPDVPEKLRGTYTALAHPSVIEHVKSLGVTSIELLPIHESVTDSFLADKGLTNYWGYSTLNFFSPDQRFAEGKHPGAAVGEFKAMVKALHSAGLEVILDVVYNHTCEGNHLGPSLSFKGIDNASYYWLMPEPRHYLDFTGCGNSLNASNPYAARFIMDSLRYWVTEMHVDGFRFDLASVLGRTGAGGYDRNAAFLQTVMQDPIVSRAKLIAEPWDNGTGGYQVGNFPAPWREWNGKYRDTVRKFWKGDENTAADMGFRLSGNADLFEGDKRRVQASINFITAHDGFTLHDLVTYDEKHNEPNLEDNRDGANDNQSWNHGVEGETDDVAIITLRERQKRNLFSTLFLSQGVPMIVAGDEMGRTQKGSNNTYCQDDELSWVDWKLDERRKDLLDFARRIVRFRHSQPVLQRRRFFRGDYLGDSGEKDVTWLRPDASEMTPADWNSSFVRSWSLRLAGDAIPSLDESGERIIGDGLLILFNAHHEPLDFKLPPPGDGPPWVLEFDTEWAKKKAVEVKEDGYRLTGRSLAVLRQPRKT